MTQAVIIITNRYVDKQRERRRGARDRKTIKNDYLQCCVCLTTGLSISACVSANEKPN